MKKSLIALTVSFMLMSACGNKTTPKNSDTKKTLNKVTAAMIKQSADEYRTEEAKKIQKSLATGQSSRGNDHCYPNKSACVNKACEFLGDHNCNDLDEIKTVSRACSGNFGGGCIELACSYVGNHNCNDLDEMVVIAGSCKGVTDTKCIETVCKKVGNHNCNDIEEIKEVASVCSDY